MEFTRTAVDPGSNARTGVFTTAHGEVRTPIFMPVGTVGSVKGVYHKDLKEDIDYWLGMYFKNRRPYEGQALFGLQRVTGQVRQ